MATEVFLMSDVEGLGAEGDVVRVADGYARNYLFPRKLAAPVTDATRKRLAKIRRERDAARKMQLEEAQRLVTELEKESYTIKVKVGPEEKLYGSVGVADIAEAVKAQGRLIDRHKIDLPEPIKELGIYDVNVKLHADVTARIKVWVVEE
jgi:large subunit ribosomal protein L9